MRAGVGAVQHTLTPAAASVVKAAFNDARRRSHSQVQPLHVAAILLQQSTPGSPLRRACIQTHPREHAHVLHCRALELCFKIALDRLPSNSETSSNPVLSNALVAALKRAQAHQRRGTPEQSLQPLLAVKVEMDQLIISILDDPSVSRVMREAGFSSTDVKSNLEEVTAQCSPLIGSSSPSFDSNSQLRRRDRYPVIPLTAPALVESPHFRNSQFASPGLLSDKSADPFRVSSPLACLDSQGETESLMNTFAHHDRGPTLFSSGASPFLGSVQYHKRPDQSRLPCLVGRSADSSSLMKASALEEDVQKLEDIFLGDKKRSPVLVGDVPHSVTAVIAEFSQRLKRGVVPAGLQGVQLIPFPFTALSVALFTEEEIEQKMGNLTRRVEGCLPRGAIISMGDIGWLVDGMEPSCSSVRLISQELGRLLLCRNAERLWLLASASLRLNFPLLEKQWELQFAQMTPANLRSRFGNPPGRIYMGESPLSVQQDSANVSQSSVGTGEGADKLRCCEDCTLKFKHESLLLQDRELRHLSENSFVFGSSGATTSSTLPTWLLKHADNNQTPIQVKEEKNVAMTQRLRDLRQKWEQSCQSDHLQSRSGCQHVESTGGEACASSSSEYPDGLLHQDRNSVMLRTQVSSLSMMRKPAEPVKMTSLFGVSSAYPKLLSPVLPHWVSSEKKILSSYPGQGSVFEHSKKITDDGTRSGHQMASWLKNGNLTGSNCEGTRASPEGVVPDTVGTDLALGCPISKSMAGLTPRRIDLFANKLPHMSVPVCPDLVHKFKEQSSACSSRSLPWQNLARAPASSLEDSRQSMSCSNGVPRGSEVHKVPELFSSLVNRVGWQKEAIGNIAATVTQGRSGLGRRRGMSMKGDVWLLLLGTDRVGKREIAKGLAKGLFGCEKQLIWMGFSTKEDMSSTFQQNSGLLQGEVNQISFRGKSKQDRLVEAVRMKPLSVVLLEDVDQADMVVRGSLVRAMERGKLADSNGREVSVSNSVMIMTCTMDEEPNNVDRLVGSKGDFKFSEENLSGLSPCGLRFVVGKGRTNALEQGVPQISFIDCHLSQQLEVHGVDTAHTSQLHSLTQKRTADQSDLKTIPFSEKRLKKEGLSPSRGWMLDLNLSAEENEPVEDHSCTTEDEVDGCLDSDKRKDSRGRMEVESAECISLPVTQVAQKGLPNEFLSLVDATVSFKPFDFEKLAKCVVEDLHVAFKKLMAEGAAVQVDTRALEQMVASAWQTLPDEEVFPKWGREVLERSVSSLVEKYSMGPDSVVKLIPDRWVHAEHQGPDVIWSGLLPSAICMDGS